MQQYSRALGRPITNLVMSREASEAGHSYRFGKGADRLHQSPVRMGKPPFPPGRQAGKQLTLITLLSAWVPGRRETVPGSEA